MDDLFSHDMIVDRSALGNEPSSDYLERVKTLDKVVRECMQLSSEYAGIKAPTNQHFFGSVLFTMLLTKAVSLCILAPHSLWSSKIIEHWDYGSMTGVVRTMLEVRLAFFYLCVEQCSEEEWRCRWNLFNLHDCTSRQKLFEARPDSYEQVKTFP